MAPELMEPSLNEKISYGTDIFALGLITYEMISKTPLFEGYFHLSLFSNKRN